MILRYIWYQSQTLLQESVNKMDVLATFSTDHSLLFTLSVITEDIWGNGLWKFNNSLTVRTTNPFRQLLSKGEDLPVRGFRKWKIFPKRKIKIYIKNK